MLSSGADAAGLDNINNTSARIVANAIVAGLISEATGGKFVNGAVTAAFRVGFGELARSQNDDFSGMTFPALLNASKEGQKSNFEFDGKSFVVIGGTSEERASVESDVIDILGTPRGQQMLVELNTRRQFLFFKKQFTIDLNVTNNAFVRRNDSDTIYIDPNFHPKIQTTAGPIPATTRRILAHEFGHAAFKTRDVGYGRMRNVTQNENPIMNSLNQPSRTRY